MAGVGFLMILANALSYLLSWESDLAVLGILGLVFVAIGMSWTRKAGSQKKCCNKK